MAKEHVFSEGPGLVFQALILVCIYILASAVRLFSVLKYESIIHEFDPWFNFRTTRYLVSEGFYELHNWFDTQSWYPLGRWVGNTVYPGLMWTAAFLYKILHLLNLPIDIRNVCVFLAPFFASNTAIVVYLLTKEIWTPAAGIMAAFFVALTPGYISRSVAGSYDNEAVAIFALLFTFYLWIKAVKTGSLMWSALSALGYFYMVAAWGGYIFIINIIPFHVLVLLVTGRFSRRIYVAYTTFYPIATLLSMNIGFVQFQPVTSPEHFGAFAMFCLLQAYLALHYLRTILSWKQFRFVIGMLGLSLLAVVAGLVLLAATGAVPFLTGRFKSLLGSTSNIAIVKSVSEHQPTAWGTFFLDLHVCALFAVPGMYFCLESLTDENLFIMLYLLFSSYFSSIMVRLILVISPAVSITAGIGFSETLLTFTRDNHNRSSQECGVSHKSHKKRLAEASTANSDNELEEEHPKNQESYREFIRSKMISVHPITSYVTVMILFVLLYFYAIHSSFISSYAHSSPNIILSSQRNDGSRVIFDDFRESYQWLRHNTAEDAKIMSWWDYGYQITGMANRTTIVDNNTRNNSHIATVGTAMASKESRAIEIMSMLDVDYVLVIFGGQIGYSSDDINKFLWMVRIGAGVFPEIVESRYMSPRHGQYTVNSDASETMLDSLMYKMCYYRYAEQQNYGMQPGFDRTRNYVIGRKDISFDNMEEAFTSEHWLVRIYRVLPKNSNR